MAASGPQTAITGWRVERVRALERMAELTEQWADLAARAVEANVFYSPVFALAAWRHLAGDAGPEWLLVWRDHAAGGEGARLVGLLPVVAARLGPGLPANALAAWTHPLAPLSTPLLARGEEEEAAAALAGALSGAETNGRFFLQRLGAEGVAQGALDAALAAAGHRPRRFGAHRRACLAGGLEGEAYLRRSLGKKRFKELRRQAARLSERGGVRFEIAAGAAEIAAAGEAYLALEAAGWKGRRGSALAQHEGGAAFFREVLAGLAARGEAWVARLSVDGAAIAAAVVLFSGRRAWLWKIAYDENWRRFSPGVLLACDLTRRLLAQEQVEMVDSCAVADHPMIDHIWRERLDMADRLAPLLPGIVPVAALVGAERARLAALGAARALRRRLRGH